MDDVGLNDEERIRRLIDNWAAAVRRRDIEAILRYHSPDFVMFDVPPPFEIHGLDAYRKS
jgi:ketosteroid isomerase-like protein